jgi:tRNA wybutosine-synthesizing protein 2
MRLAKVPRGEAEELRKRIAAADGLRKDVRIMEEEEVVLIPLSDDFSDRMANEMGLVVVEGDANQRPYHLTPFQEASSLLRLPERLKQLLPRKWELLGDVLVLRLVELLEPFKSDIARAYAAALHARTVCREVGAIGGVHRTPRMEVLFGSGTVTVHKENGILYKLDVIKLMFSSGNVEEKRRMASLDCAGETVVDLFAGIGYFTLPVAKHAHAARVVACEINPVAFGYLKENISLNGVQPVVEPFLGDNRDLPGEGFADRVLMGYVGTTDRFLPKAFSLIRSGGTIHYHETCAIDEWPERPIRHIRQHAAGRRIEILRQAEVKSFAPAISHYVIDFRVLG